MTDYSKGQIYTIRNCDDNTLIYVGSTVQPLHKRFYQHKLNSKRERCMNIKLYVTVNNNWENWYIELYELYSCNSKNELCKREGQVIRLIGNLNSQITGRTMKEYHIENADKIKEQKKEYQIENADKIKEYNKQYHIENADKIKEYNKQYYIENADKIKEYNKEYKIENADKIKEQKKEYYIENVNKIKEQKKEYYIETADKIKEYNKQYYIENVNKIKEKT